MKTIIFPALLIIAGSFLFAPEGYAGKWSWKCCKREKEWFERKGQQFGDAVSDVVTVGENGRNRDNERAQAEEEQARIKREAAEREKQEKLASLEDKKRLIGEFLQAFTAYSEFTEIAGLDLALLTESAKRQLSERTWWSRYGFPRWSRSLLEEQEFSAEVLAQLEALLLARSAIDASPVGRFDISAEQQRYEQNRQAFENVRTALANLKALALSSQLETKELISLSLRHLSAAEAESMLNGLSALSHLVANLKEYSSQRISYFENELKNLDAQIEALNSVPQAPEQTQPAPTPPAPAPIQAPLPPHERHPGGGGMFY